MRHVILTQSAESGFFKILGDRLRADPQSRCLNSSQCVKFAKGGHAVYPAVQLRNYKSINAASIFKFIRNYNIG